MPGPTDTAVTATPSLAPEVVRAATGAVFVAFVGSGFAFASWASRIPQVKAQLDLGPSAFGLVLLAVAVGSLTALPLAGPVVAAVGARRTVTAMALLLAVALGVVLLGYAYGVALVVVGLYLLGLANGAWDVAMNVQGAAVEQLRGRAIMPRFHAGFSFGMTGGALLGTAAVAAGVPVPVHLGAVAVLVGVAVPLSVRRFVDEHLTDPVAEPGTEAPRPRRSALAAWREPRTLAVGLFVLVFAFAEGVGNDWIGIALVDDKDAGATAGTLGLAIFVLCMALGRWFGPPLLDRHGRVRVCVALAVVGIAGVLLFVLSPWTALGLAGLALWGAGTALGFPVGMSAAADEPAHAASRVSVVASIGYCAFLGGPPLIGLLGERVTVLSALMTVAVMLAGALVLARSVAPLRTSA